jgi:DNA polymerase-3 subunit alpha
MHAGGVLIAPGKLTDFCPLYQQPGSPAAVSQFDKDDVEAIGLVTFDFLGLSTLTILEKAKQLVVDRYPEYASFNYEDIPLNDEKTYALFSQGKTEAVFQFESRGMQAMLKDAKPTRLEDLIVLNALFRPGPMSLIPSFVARKHGREPVEYPHPLAEPILSETYGIMVYQEQVMQIAQVLGGYSLGGADLLRRAMGKKKADEMALHRSVFREGAAKNQISTNQADAIFDLMEEFAGYGFNKSHAAAYSLLAYHTAWLKVHFPAEFFSANMTVEMDDTDKLKILYDDASDIGIGFEPPDINAGEYEFKPVTKKTIRYGLGAIKGTGKAAIEAICEERRTKGNFDSLFDFCSRIDRSRVNRRTVEALVKAGAFDNIWLNRAELIASVGLAFEFAQSQENNINQGGLFDAADEHGSGNCAPDLIAQRPWGIREKLTFEKSAVGFHLSGHLFDEVGEEVRKFIKNKLSDLTESRDLQWVAGIVRSERSIPTAKGKLNIFVLDDGTCSVEITSDDALFEKYRPLLREDKLVICLLKIQNDRRNGGLRFSLTDAIDLPSARCRFGKFLRISISGAEVPESQKFKQLMSLLYKPNQITADCVLPVRMHLNFLSTEVQLDLGEKAHIHPTDDVLSALSSHLPLDSSLIVYD